MNNDFFLAFCQLQTTAFPQPPCRLTKDEYNKKWREEHPEYHKQKAKENYLRNKDKISLRNALKRYNQGKTVRSELVEKLRAKNLI